GRFGLVRLEVQRDARAGCLALGRLERELAAAVGAPAPGLAAPGAARDDLDARGDQEARVEADAELADQLGRRRAARLADLLEEGLGARARDRAQVRDQLVVAHAHAAVVHAQRARLGIELEPDARLGLGRGELGLRQRLEAALVERVAGVRDQLAQEDLAVPVEGVDHQAEDFAGLGLETQGLARLAHGGDHSGHRRGLCKPGRALGSGVELRSPWDRNPSTARAWQPPRWGSPRWWACRATRPPTRCWAARWASTSATCACSTTSATPRRTRTRTRTRTTRERWDRRSRSGRRPSSGAAGCTARASATP